MALLDTIINFFRKREPQVEPDTTIGARELPTGVTGWTNQFQADRLRREQVLTSRDMWRTDGRVKKILREMGLDALRGGFTLSVKNNDEAQEVGEALFKRLNLEKTGDTHIWMAARDGDLFLELGVDQDRLIRQLSVKPALQMHRNSDEWDGFESPLRAFWYYPEQVVYYSQEAPEDAVWWPVWLIVHARWEHEPNQRYGTPLFGASTGAYKKSNQGEVDMAVTRKTRSGTILVHSLKGATPTELDAYMEKNKSSIDSPFAAVREFFSNADTALSVVQGDTRLGEFSDVTHHLQTWLAASPYPYSLLGYGDQNLSERAIEEQIENYHQALIEITEWFDEQVLSVLLHRQWLLSGILPANVDYKINFTTKKTMTASSLLRAAEAFRSMHLSGLFSPEYLFDLASQFMPGLDPKLEMERFLSRQAALPDELGRLALGVGRGWKPGDDTRVTQGRKEPGSQRTSKDRGGAADDEKRPAGDQPWEDPSLRRRKTR